MFLIDLLFFILLKIASLKHPQTMFRYKSVAITTGGGIFQIVFYWPKIRYATKQAMMSSTCFCVYVLCWRKVTELAWFHGSLKHTHTFQARAWKWCKFLISITQKPFEEISFSLLRSTKTHPGPVVHLSDSPKDEGKVRSSSLFSPPLHFSRSRELKTTKSTDWVKE